MKRLLIVALLLAGCAPQRPQVYATPMVVDPRGFCPQGKFCIDPPGWYVQIAIDKDHPEDVNTPSPRSSCLPFSAVLASDSNAVELKSRTCYVRPSPSPSPDIYYIDEPNPPDGPTYMCVDYEPYPLGLKCVESAANGKVLKTWYPTPAPFPTPTPTATTYEHKYYNDQEWSALRVATKACKPYGGHDGPFIAENYDLSELTWKIRCKNATLHTEFVP